MKSLRGANSIAKNADGRYDPAGSGGMTWLVKGREGVRHPAPADGTQDVGPMAAYGLSQIKGAFLVTQKGHSASLRFALG